MGDLPWLNVQQSLDDPALFHDAQGKAYTTEDLERLEATHNILAVVYDPDWRGDGKPRGIAGGELVRLRWEEGEEEGEGHL